MTVRWTTVTTWYGCKNKKRKEVKAAEEIGDIESDDERIKWKIEKKKKLKEKDNEKEDTLWRVIFAGVWGRCSLRGKSKDFDIQGWFMKQFSNFLSFCLWKVIIPKKTRNEEKNKPKSKLKKKKKKLLEEMSWKCFVRKEPKKKKKKNKEKKEN